MSENFQTFIALWQLSTMSDVAQILFGGFFEALKLLALKIYDNNRTLYSARNHPNSHLPT